MADPKGWGVCVCVGGVSKVRGLNPQRLSTGDEL